MGRRHFCKILLTKTISELYSYLSHKIFNRLNLCDIQYKKVDILFNIFYPIKLKKEVTIYVRKLPK